MMMTTPAAMLSAPPPMDLDTTEVIRTRFGDITIDTQNALHFPRGLLGLADREHFVLANLPSPKMQQFKLFQSLDDLSLSFVTLPLPIDNTILQKDDIIMACNDLGISSDQLALLLIISVQRMPESVRITANARAPIFIDADRRLGAQFVFQHDRYKVQQIISG